MSGLDKMKNQILDEANHSAEAKIAEAKAKAEEIIQAAKAEAEEEAGEIRRGSCHLQGACEIFLRHAAEKSAAPGKTGTDPRCA